MDYNDPARLRNAAAGLIKSLIRARCAQEPAFVSADDLRRWGVADAVSDDRPCVQLLTRVRQLRGRFERDFLHGQDSISAPGAAADAEAMDAVIDQVASFLYGDLDDAVRRAARGEDVRWEALADWNRLAALRDALDRLPETTRSGQGASDRSAHHTREDEDGPVAPDGFVYRGRRYTVRAGLVFRLLDALWRAPNRTLSYDELAGPVWKDHAVEVTDGKIGSVRTRANGVFKEHDLPFRVQRILLQRRFGQGNQPVKALSHIRRQAIKEDADLGWQRNHCPPLSSSALITCRSASRFTSPLTWIR